MSGESTINIEQLIQEATMKKTYGKRVAKEAIPNHMEAANRFLDLRRTRHDRDHRIYWSNSAAAWIVASYELIPRDAMEEDVHA